MTKEYEYFNCEEDYEHEYVASLFTEPAKGKKMARKNVRKQYHQQHT